MRTTLRSPATLAGIVLVAAACSADSLSPVISRTKAAPVPLFAQGGCAQPYVTGGILQPVNPDNSSVFELSRTVPLKIRVTDCVTGAPIDQLSPVVQLLSLGSDGTVNPVNEVVSSSAADEGATMRPAGNGGYIYNLSTKRSQFNAGDDLLPGRYELHILGGGQFTDVVVQFSLRR